MSYGRAAGLGAAAGAVLAAALTLFAAARAAHTITRARRWYQLKHL